MLCKQALQAMLEGVLTGLVMKLDEVKEYSPREDRTVMISPLFDATLHKASDKRRSQVPNGACASDHAPAAQYVRRRHQSQDGPVPSSKSTSSFRLNNSGVACYPAADPRFHHKEA